MYIQCDCVGHRKPHVPHRLEHASLNVNVWYAVICDGVFSPFCGNVVHSGSYLVILELYAVPQIQDAGLPATANFEQDGTPSS